MNGITAFGSVSSNVGTAYAARALHRLHSVISTTGMPLRPVAPAAHAAWAVDAIAPQRKRRTAAATDASVDRGFV